MEPGHVKPVGAAFRFGVFELDRRSGELRKHGIRLKLQDQPFRVLVKLLERPGEVVTREEIYNELWSEETFVSREDNLNTAIRKIRDALGDTADHPKFVETLPRRGYRFVYPIERKANPVVATDGRPVHAEASPSEGTTVTQAAAARGTDGAQSAPVAQREGQATEIPDLRGKYGVVQALMVVTAIIFLVVGFLYYSQNTPDAPVDRFSFEVEQLRVAPGRRMAISPNGRRIAYGTPEGLWVQDLDQFRPRLLANTEDAYGPFWSPESDFVGFAVGADLMKVRIDGGDAIPICRMPSSFFVGGTWSPDGVVIVFSVDHTRVLHQVSASGGQPLRILSEEESARMGEDAADVLQFSGKIKPHMGYPKFLPAEAGDRVLLMELGFGGLETMMVLDLETGRREFLGRGGTPVYAPRGHLVYAGGGDLWAVPFSLDTLRTTGTPFRVAQNARRGPSVAGDGTLVYVDEPLPMMQLLWLDRTGDRMDVIGEPHRLIYMPSLSPDGLRVAYSAVGNRTQEIWPFTNRDIWVYDATRASARTPLIQGESPARESNPIWSPSGDMIAFGSDVKGEMNIYLGRADGSGEARPMAGSDARQRPWDWSSDGKYILFRSNDLKTGYDLWVAELSGDGKTWEPRPYLKTPANETVGKFSPDGRYVAYTSRESGRSEVYIRSFPDGHGPVQVSTKKGFGAFVWSRETGELFYVEIYKGDRWMVSVPITTEPELSIGTRRRLFKWPQGVVEVRSVSADGRFLAVERVGDSPKPAIRVVQNWYEEFRDR